MKRNTFHSAFRNAFMALLNLVFLFGAAATSSAQVKQVEMHIAGYLCGN